VVSCDGCIPCVKFLKMKTLAPLPAPKNWMAYIEKQRGFIREHTAEMRPPLAPEMKLYLADKMTPLWKITEAALGEKDVPPPYWSFAWPGGQALARHVLDKPELVRGRSVFDFASGSGIAGIAAAKAGAAHVTASDVDPAAIVAIGLNAEINGALLTASHDDWCGRSMEAYDIILAGDVCYEWPMAGYAIEWLRREVAAGREVIFADPGRTYLPQEGLEKLAEYDVPTTLEVEDSEVKRTAVYRLLAEDE
jgi:predicted nicotinamide N-methyase